MTGGAQVEVLGAAELARSFAAAGRALQDWSQVNASAGQLVANAAKQRAPKRTGRLSNSVASTASKDGAEITAGVPYAKVQEFGWAAHNIAAQPYLRPGLSDSQATIIPKYQARIDDVLAKVKGA